MKIIEGLIQGSEVWHVYRKSRIGASDSAAVLGVSKWASALELWERKLGISPEQEENSAMSRGKALEEEARQEFMHLKQIAVEPQVVEHDSLPWMFASLDGLSWCQKYAVEIKVPGRENHLLALRGFVPEHYWPQLQHQLAVTGLDMIYYYSYDGLNNACIEVQRDQDYIDKLIAEELKFYKCMVTCTPPELSERDYNIRNDREWESLVRRWKYAKSDLDYAKDMEQSARDLLIKASESKNSKGFGVKVQKITRQGSIDYSQIKELDGVNLDSYRKPSSESWRITLDE